MRRVCQLWANPFHRPLYGSGPARPDDQVVRHPPQVRAGIHLGFRLHATAGFKPADTWFTFLSRVVRVLVSDPRRSTDFVLKASYASRRDPL